MDNDRIANIRARQVLDSRGNPTVEADVVLTSGVFGRAAVPSGASTGTNEAVERRDGGPAYGGLGVLKAVKAVNETIATALEGSLVSDQTALDQTLIDLDGTPTKKKLGANAILAVSLAAARAAALNRGQSVAAYLATLAGRPAPKGLPVPMMNIINGGRHAAGSTDIQEFMIMPAGLPSFSEALRAGSEIFHALQQVLSAEGYGTTVGDEGGFAPAVREGNREALELIGRAVKSAGYKLGEEIFLAIDVAASELRDTAGAYQLKKEGRTLKTESLINWYAELIETQPIVSIEDGLGEDDWAGWQAMTERLGAGVQLVGDDIFVTNSTYLKKGIEQQAGNAILIKPNQIGTLTETIATVEMARQARWPAIISHRSGETEDATIADLVVGLGTGQIKTGSLCRSERTAKYNQLLRLEEELGRRAVYAGMSVIKR